MGKCLPNKLEDVSSDLQGSCKQLGMQCAPTLLALWKRRLEDPRGWLSSSRFSDRPYLKKKKKGG